MSGRGNLRSIFASDGVIFIVPSSFRHRAFIVPPSLTPSLTPSLSQIEALQGVYFEGMAMIRPLRKKALFQGVFEAN